MYFLNLRFVKLSEGSGVNLCIVVDTGLWVWKTDNCILLIVTRTEFGYGGLAVIYGRGK